MKKVIYIYVMETMSDWELAYLMPMIRQEAAYNQGQERYQLMTVSATKDSLITAGGLTVIPDCTVAEMSEDVAALILPGADTWAEAVHLPILEKAAHYVTQDILVAGICGATLALANMGLLDTRYHTSSALGFLTGFSKTYQGSDCYQQRLSVTDKNLITASPAGALPFARDVLTYLRLIPTPMLTAWYNYYHTGDEAYFFELMALSQ